VKINLLDNLAKNQQVFDEAIVADILRSRKISATDLA
jgi:hypothetical protein